MLELISGWFAKRRQQQLYQDFCRRWGFQVDGGHFSIARGHVGIVTEYGYLLRAYSDGAHDGFHLFDAITRDLPQIDARMVRDLQAQVPLEQQRLKVSRETAVGNLKRLRLALECIEEYVHLTQRLDRLKLPVNPLPAPPTWA